MEYKREVAEKILADPNSDQLSRDLAHIRLAEEQPSSRSTSGDTVQASINEKCDEWMKVEAFERGLLALSDEEAIAFAVEALLIKKTTSIWALNDANGKPSPLLAHPKLVKVAKKMIRTNHSNKADAHAVLGFFNRRTTDPYEAVQHFSKAIQIRPKDWRLRSQLASTYMKIGNLSLCLQSLLVAIELAPTDYNKFVLYRRKSNVLFNLQRTEEAKASFQHYLEQSTKFESQMTQKDIGELAVSLYMLCQLFIMERDKKNALQHWKQAEAKRNALPKDISHDMDGSARTLAQTCMGALDPNLLSHQECHNCRILVENPKTCSACKVAVYCSKACQIAAWKRGHKRECQQAKSNRKAKRQEQKQATKTERTDLPLLDAGLDPRELWSNANELAKKQDNAQEAVFLYLVALFMDFSFNAQNLTLARKAVDVCDPDDPLAIALSMVVHSDKSNSLEMCTKAQEKVTLVLKHKQYMPVGQEDVKTIEKLDRFQFGLAMTFIFRARILNHCLPPIRSLEELLCMDRTQKEAFQVICKLIAEAKVFLDSNRWLTFQHELGYSNLQVAATDEAKRWLGLFLNGLEHAAGINGSLNRHWTTMKASAEEKLGMVPILEFATESGLMP